MSEHIEVHISTRLMDLLFGIYIGVVIGVILFDCVNDKNAAKIAPLRRSTRKAEKEETSE